jgi:integrase
MANTAAYSGLRWGELAALTADQIDQGGRVITVDRKVAEIAGHLYLVAPKNRKRRQTIYPRVTPTGYPLADRLAARAGQARAEQHAGTNPLGLIFPSPQRKYWRSSNINRNVLKRAYHAARWRDATGNGHRTPVVMLAADADLQDVELAYQRWWEVPEAIRTIVAGHGSTRAGRPGGVRGQDTAPWQRSAPQRAQYSARPYR